MFRNPSPLDETENAGGKPEATEVVRMGSPLASFSSSAAKTYQLHAQGCFDWDQAALMCEAPIDAVCYQAGGLI